MELIGLSGVLASLLGLTLPVYGVFYNGRATRALVRSTQDEVRAIHETTRAVHETTRAVHEDIRAFREDSQKRHEETLAYLKEMDRRHLEYLQDMDRRRHLSALVASKG